MALIIATGSNLGDRVLHLGEAKSRLGNLFPLVAASKIYCSPPVDYRNQPDFLNQVLEFKTPEIPPLAILGLLQEIEKSMGRKREIPKGPRTIDLDILFIDFLILTSGPLILPHPHWDRRSFVILPLQELPFSQKLAKKFPIPSPSQLENHAFPFVQGIGQERD